MCYLYDLHLQFCGEGEGDTGGGGSLIVCEKNPLSNPDDFIHGFLLIFSKLSCLLTSKTATPLPHPLP